MRRYQRDQDPTLPYRVTQSQEFKEREAARDRAKEVALLAAAQANPGASAEKIIAEANKLEESFWR